MKRIIKLMTSLIIAGLLLCSNLTVFAAEDRNVNEDYYTGYYNLMVSYQIETQENSIFVKDAFTQRNIWDAEKVDEDMYTSTIVYARYKPNMEDKAGPLLGAGTSVKRVGISPNGWDLIEYNDNLYFIWYEYLTYEIAAPEPQYIATQPEESYSTWVDESQASDPAPVTDENGMTYVGYYELTAYEWTGNTCANGNYPTTGYTVACNSLPLGTTIYIEGYGTYVVEDTGGMGGGVVDIYMGDVDTCIQFGRQGANIYIVN